MLYSVTRGDTQGTPAGGRGLAVRRVVKPLDRNQALMEFGHPGGCRVSLGGSQDVSEGGTEPVDNAL